MKSIVHVMVGLPDINRTQGISAMVSRLVQKQKSEGWKVQLWCLSYTGVDAVDWNEVPIRVFKLSAGFRLDEEILSAVKDLDKEHVVHFHGGYVQKFFSLSNWLVKLGIPFILSPYGAYMHHAGKVSKMSKLMYATLFEQVLWSRASAIQLHAMVELDDLSAKYKNKTVLIPLGYDVDKVQDSAVMVHHNKLFTIAYAGRTNVRTCGLDKLVHSFARFHKQVPDSELWLMVDGAQTDILKAMCRTENLHGAVEFLGSSALQEKQELLSQTSIFVYPVMAELMPVEVLDAAILGVPLVVSKASGLQQWLTEFDAGIVLQELTITELVSAFFELYERMVVYKQSELLQQNVRKMMRQVFDWTKVLNDYKVLYTKVA